MKLSTGSNVCKIGQNEPSGVIDSYVAFPSIYSKDMYEDSGI